MITQIRRIVETQADTAELNKQAFAAMKNGDMFLCGGVLYVKLTDTQFAQHGKLGRLNFISDLPYPMRIIPIKRLILEY